MTPPAPRHGARRTATRRTRRARRARGAGVGARAAPLSDGTTLAYTGSSRVGQTKRAGKSALDVFNNAMPDGNARCES